MNSTLCALNESNLYVVYTVGAVFMGSANLVLLVAAISNFRILRQNVVYYYIISLLACPVVTSVLVLYDTWNQVGEWERKLSGTMSYSFNKTNQQQRNVMLWYAFRRSITASMYVVSILNISALSYGVGSTSFFVGRYLALRGTLTSSERRIRGVVTRQEEKAKVRSRRRRIAAVIITFTWIAPFIYGGLSLRYNCIDSCMCLPANYASNTCIEDNTHLICSMFWEPLTTGFMFSSFVPWLIGHIINAFMLVRTIRLYTKVISTAPTNSHEDENQVNSVSLKKSSKSTKKFRKISFRPTSRLRPRGPTQKDPVELDDNEIVKRKSKTLTLHSHPRRLKDFKRYEKKHEDSGTRRIQVDPVIKLLLILAVCNALLLSPIMVFLIYDYFTGERVQYGQLKLLGYVPIYVYFLILPASLFKYMAGLKTSLESLTIKLPCFYTTVVTSSTQKVEKKTSIPTISKTVV